MKASELRVGNYVQTNYEGILQVVNVNSAGLEYIDAHKPNFSAIGRFELSSVSGIPLTEEILLKCGFVEKKKWFYKEKFLLGYMTTDENLQAEWKFGGVEGTWNLLNLKYLHQLQNLYFALTGEELEINL